MKTMKQIAYNLERLLLKNKCAAICCTRRTYNLHGAVLSEPTQQHGVVLQIHRLLECTSLIVG